MNNKFRVLQELGADFERLASAGQTPGGRRNRRVMALVFVLIVLAGSAAVAAVLSAGGSEPLAGRVPGAHSPFGRGGILSVAGDRYTITVSPALLAGSSGWCSTLIFRSRGKLEFGAGTCGGSGSYPTARSPVFGSLASTGSSAGAPTGSTVGFVLTGPGVAAVRLGAKVIRVRSDRGLPAGDGAAVFFIPAGRGLQIAGESPPEPPPAPPRGPGSPRPASTEVLLTPLDGAGHELSSIPSSFELPNRYWQTPGKPPRGACQIRQRGLPRLTAQWGHVISGVRSVPGLLGAGFLSCVDTEYYFHGWPLQAAVLLDARHPGATPGELPGANPIPGHVGIVDVPLGPFPGSITAHRVGDAWLVVQGGRDLRQRLQVLGSLAVAKIDLRANRGRDPRSRLDRCPATARAIPRASGGTPRLINPTATHVLLCRYGALRPGRAGAPPLAGVGRLADRHDIQILARQFNGLPPLPTAPHACPRDDGSQILTIFNGDSAGIRQQVSAGLQGCQAVPSLSPARTLRFSPGGQSLYNKLRALTLCLPGRMPPGCLQQ